MSASPSQQLSHTTPNQSFQPTLKKKNTSKPEATAGKSTQSLQKEPLDRVQPEAEVTLDSLLQLSEVDEEFVSLINTAPPSSKPILRLIQTFVLDSGGQPQFHELMPIFLNGASEFIYVFKAHESLGTRSMIRYFDKEGTLVLEFPASQNNEETLRQCTCSMSSLTAKNPDIPPPGILSGHSPRPGGEREAAWSTEHSAQEAEGDSLFLSSRTRSFFAIGRGRRHLHSKCC